LAFATSKRPDVRRTRPSGHLFNQPVWPYRPGSLELCLIKSYQIQSLCHPNFSDFPTNPAKLWIKRAPCGNSVPVRSAVIIGLFDSRRLQPACHKRWSPASCWRSASWSWIMTKEGRDLPGLPAFPDLDPSGRTYIMSSMPPIPPMPPGIAGILSFLGASAIPASVVIIRPAMEAASCSAVRTTLAGSTIPASTIST
jgi:hypothetical protein